MDQVTSGVINIEAGDQGDNCWCLRHPRNFCHANLMEIPAPVILRVLIVHSPN